MGVGIESGAKARTIITSTVLDERQEARCRGLRMTAEEYFELQADGARHELVDGAFCMSPNPSCLHQRIVTVRSSISPRMNQGRLIIAGHGARFRAPGASTIPAER